MTADEPMSTRRKEGIDYRSRRGSRNVTADCVTCGREANPSTGEHNQRAWARTHASNNPGHQVHVEVTSVRIYRSARSAEGDAR